MNCLIYNKTKGDKKMRKLIVASNNGHKVLEIKEMLNKFVLQV